MSQCTRKIIDGLLTPYYSPYDPYANMISKPEAHTICLSLAISVVNKGRVEGEKGSNKYKKTGALKKLLLVVHLLIPLNQTSFGEQKLWIS